MSRYPQDASASCQYSNSFPKYLDKTGFISPCLWVLPNRMLMVTGSRAMIWCGFKIKFGVAKGFHRVPTWSDFSSDKYNVWSVVKWAWHHSMWADEGVIFYQCGESSTPSSIYLCSMEQSAWATWGHSPMGHPGYKPGHNKHSVPICWRLFDTWNYELIVIDDKEFACHMYKLN